MDAIFARLSHKGSKPSVRDPGGLPFSRPDMGMFSFKGPSDIVQAKEPVRNNIAKSEASAVADTTIEHSDTTKNKRSAWKEQGKHLTEELKRSTQLLMEAKAKPATEERLGMTQAEVEHEYLVRASEYIDALPFTVGTTAHLIQVVSRKLRSTYTLELETSRENSEIIKARFAFAIAKHINKALREGQKALTADSIKEMLKDLDGDFLQLCSILVHDNYISLETLDDVTGLVKTMLDVLPKAESTVGVSTTHAPKPESQSKPDVSGSETNTKFPIESRKGWPSQEKRESRELISVSLEPTLTIGSGLPSHLYLEGRRQCY